MRNDETDPETSTKKKKKSTILTRNELNIVAKDLDLIKTISNLKTSEDELGIGLREIQYKAQQETKSEKLPPRSSVHKGIQRLKSANLVRNKKRRIPPAELSRYRGWRVKRQEETNAPDVAENGKIEVQYGFELTSRGEEVVEFIEDHLELDQSDKESEGEPDDESGDNIK